MRIDQTLLRLPSIGSCLTWQNWPWLGAGCRRLCQKPFSRAGGSHGAVWVSMAAPARAGPGGGGASAPKPRLMGPPSWGPATLGWWMRIPGPTVKGLGSRSLNLGRSFQSPFYPVRSNGFRTLTPIRLSLRNWHFECCGFCGQAFWGGWGRFRRQRLFLFGKWKQ